MGCISSSKKIMVSSSEGKNGTFKASNGKNINTNYSTTISKTKIKELIESSIMLNRSNIEVKDLISKIEGKVENSYKIIKNIGKGSYGKVLLVKHIQSGVIRAMKIIEKDSVIEGEQNFLKEIDILMNTEHPNIIKIFEYYVDDFNYYLITEYISGGTLIEAILKLKHLNEQKVAYIMSQILKALHYLHLKGIIHRDIKPENILIHSNNNGFLNVKLIDFGLSNYFTSDKKFSLKVGSPFFIAPEVLNHNYNYKCDIWSTGVVLHVLLMGRFPFYGKTKEELFSNILNSTLKMSSPIWDFLSKEVKDLLSHMLEYDFEKRFSAQQCLEHPWIVKHRTFANPEKVDPNYGSFVFQNLSKLQSREIFQKATIAYITYSYYYSKEIDALQNLFSLLDTNEDGLITFEEFSEGIAKYYDRDNLPKEEDFKKIFDEIDSNWDGKISYEEFLRATVNIKKLLSTKNLKLAFDHFDLNKDGKLSKAEIRAALNTTNYEYVNQLVEAIDTNNDGMVSFEEFQALMETVL